MKAIKLFVMAVLAISLTGCSAGGELTPTSKKVNGPLGKYFEVVERDYKLNENELRVEFKRIANGGPKEADSDTEPTFIVELQDEDGNSIVSDRTHHIFGGEEQLDAVFSLGVDESASISFKFDADTKDAAKFKVSSKWGGADSSSDGSTESSGDQSTDISSQDSNINIYSWLSDRLVTEDDLYGKSMQDLKIMRNTIFAMHGYIFKTKDMKEYFEGQSWYTPKKDNVSSELTSIEQKNIAFIKNKENGGLSGDVTAGSTDWDAILDSYDSYVTKYMSYMKKAKNGDVSALSEYPAFMEKAQALGDKLSRAKGEMSAAQWSRYIKITNRLATVAQ